MNASGASIFGENARGIKGEDRMRSSPILLAALAAMSAMACGQRTPASPFAGTWTMTLNDHPFMVLNIREESGRFAGELSRPGQFTTSDFIQFSRLDSHVATERITSAEVRGGGLHFTTVDPRDPSDTSAYDMWRDGDQSVRIKESEVPDTMEPPQFVRVVGATPSVFTGWEAGCQYRAGAVKASNAEMQRIYDADQAPRQDPGKLSAADWKEIDRKDAERRARTRELLSVGALSTADDFRLAAFIFQHGSIPGDYLLAHTLASIAGARGDASATWIMTATLDRYLQSIGQPQIYGTQFKPTPDATQEPYDRALISDALRRELGVPSLAAQVHQQQEFAKQFHPDAAR
jgi:hypothetical protein